MSRYIDAENVLKELCETCEHEKFCKEHKGSRCTEYCIIANEPTADVAPVVHAHWTCVNTNENVYMCDGKDGCGNCTILLEGTPKENDMMFCTHCGARMDEKETEQ